MAGTIKTIVNRTAYDFSTGTATVVLARAISAVAYREIVLECLVHSVDLGASSTIAVKCFSASPSEDDPAQDFVGSTALATATVDTTSAVGDLVTATLSAGAAGYLRVELVGTLSTANVKATLTIRLIMRE